MKRFRHGAEYVPDSLAFKSLDRNQRTRIMVAAEALERRTKTKGRKSGVIGQSGLRVLRCLLYDFANIPTGRCDPSYRAIRERTTYCPQTISRALQRLEKSGLVRIARRLVRLSVGAIQTTNAYAFFEEPRTLLPLGEISRETTNLIKKEDNQLAFANFEPVPLQARLREALRRLGQTMGLSQQEIAHKLK